MIEQLEITKKYLRTVLEKTRNLPCTEVSTILRLDHKQLAKDMAIEYGYIPIFSPVVVHYWIEVSFIKESLES